ncbi:cupin domain-containing protein [Parafrigoribacterium mesophilum]
MITDGITQKNFDETQDVRRFDHGHADVVEMSGATVGRVTFEPGWRWTTHLAAVAGTDSCHALHTGVVLSGRLHIRMDDGRETEAGPGDALVISRGHDAWVVGSEPAVMIDWTGLAPVPQAGPFSPAASSTTR